MKDSANGATEAGRTSRPAEVTVWAGTWHIDEPVGGRQRGCGAAGGGVIIGSTGRSRSRRPAPMAMRPAGSWPMTAAHCVDKCA